jgi:YHS domain-containing protein
MPDFIKKSRGFNDMAKSIDPICQMEVDTDNPPGGKSDYQGTTYYFCAPGCKHAFDQDPEKYVSGHEEGIPHQHHPSQRKPSFFSRLFGRRS